MSVRHGAQVAKTDVEVARRTAVLATVALAALVLIAFWPILSNGFVNYDDVEYVTENVHIQQGFTTASLKWAWTTSHCSNWHPVTWLSHILDWQLFGPASWGHHLTSLILHLVNTILLFLLLGRATGSVARGAFVAALFAVHPLRVESVAWVAERKDVLSTAFWMLTSLAYLRYVRLRHVGSYALAGIAFALGLASKPMLVTLPITLLLLDYWPLGRWPDDRQPDRSGRVLWPLLREKLPLLVLSAASATTTLVVQHSGRAVGSFEQYPVASRVLNSLVAYGSYLWMAIWPRDLAVFYPHPGSTLPVREVVGSALLLIALTVVAFRLRRRCPYLIVGWLWYVVTLVPVIGLIQVGGQAMADRYTYVPLIGVFIMVAWGVPDALAALGPAGRPVRQLWTLLPAAVVVGAFLLCTRIQAGYWLDSETLFRRALDVTGPNPVARLNLGSALADQGRFEEAIEHYSEAIRLYPEMVEAHVDLGNALSNLGRFEQAYRSFERALRIDPDSVDAHYNLGVALARNERTLDAVKHYRRALEIDPENYHAHNNLGNILVTQGDPEQAIRHFEAAIRARPGQGAVYSNLAAALFLAGRYAEAWTRIHEARRYGFPPPQPLIRQLAEKLPDPKARRSLRKPRGADG